MEIIFPNTEFPRGYYGEIDAVLHRIAIGNTPGKWPVLPDEIRILGRLSGGRSGSEVLEVIVKHGNREAHKVIKLGPLYELENEFHAYQIYLQNASALFVRIEATTPGVLNRSLASIGEREAIVYDHAARFQGKPKSRTRTFEDIAFEAVRHGGVPLDNAINVLKTFFQGVRNDLYEKCSINMQESTLQHSWNRHLGIDAVVSINHMDISNHMLKTTVATLHDKEQEILWPLDLARASVRVRGQAAKGDIVKLKGRMYWRNNHLVVEIDTHHLCVEVIPDGGMSVGQLASKIKSGSEWVIEGRLEYLRMPIIQNRLLDGLGAEFKISNQVLTGPGASLRDPFTALPDILEERRSNRITSMIHGDLNPRNILVIDQTPCVIDYALTRSNEPIFMDFGRLEACLTRDILPDDFSWKQHVRLQRLLAAACRLGDEAAQRFIVRLASEREELASAFRLLWTIRQAAREIYPRDYQDRWVHDYLEQLFLSSHLVIKWNSEQTLSKPRLYAIAALSGASAEALSDAHTYRFWSEEALQIDGHEIIEITKMQPQTSLHELANLIQVLGSLTSPKYKTLKNAFDLARTSLVKWHFRDAAHAIINQLAHDHDVYINLKAYIDLKGQLNTGRQRVRRAIMNPLEIDKLLAESERLKNTSGNDIDVLHLIAENSAVVLIGDAGSGKSTVAREWEYYLSSLIIDQDRRVPSVERYGHPTAITRSAPPFNSWTFKTHGNLAIAPRMPVILRAPDLPERLKNWESRDVRSTAGVLYYDARGIDLLTVGALYIIVDALNELSEEQKLQVSDWIIALQEGFPNTPVLVCHRQYNYQPGLLPFPVIVLQKVETTQARTYIYEYLHERAVPNYDLLANRLVTLLLDDPDHTQVRDLAQTPLFLWMVVEYYCQTREVPSSRGELFDTFSHWYLEQRYHEAYHELTRTEYTYEDKALLLGVLGYELVQRRQTNLPVQDVEMLMPQRIKNRWQKILKETIDAEMLSRDGSYLRFLHQSFQEYFAARQFLTTVANNLTAVRQKVRQFSWHDTFTVLLGFAGDAPEVITQVIEEALKVNPLLTARCLRMAEQPDQRLLDQFVNSQEAILLNGHESDFSQERAAQALAEYGRGEARATLWRIAAGASAPSLSRVASLKYLAIMATQIRFETIREQLRQELVDHLPQFLGELVSTPVQLAAIEAVATAQIKELSTYLADLVTSGDWPVRWLARRVCRTLGLPLTPRQQEAFIVACQARLDQAERELYQERIEDRINALNTERVDILLQLATPANLHLLLKRRFSFGISDKVRKMIDEVANEPGEPVVEARNAWFILNEPSKGGAINKWLEHFYSTDELATIAVAHRLIKEHQQIPIEKLRFFLNLSLTPERLSAVAYLVAATGDLRLVEPLEILIRSLMETVSGSKSFEAFSNLVIALQSLHIRAGSRIAVVATTMFYTKRGEETYRYFPWRAIENSSYLVGRDYETLLEVGGNDARVAVLQLGSFGSHMLRGGDKSKYSTELNFVARLQLQKLAEREQNPNYQYDFAAAAAHVHAVELLPWLIKLTHNPEMVKRQVISDDYRYGVCKELYLSLVLRSIGYLARIQINNGKTDKAMPAVDFLRHCYSKLQPGTERSIIVGLVIGLGYIGDWEPILANLGPGEPWMHEAAKNVFAYWLPTTNTTSREKQDEEIALWIARWLRTRTNLDAQARSTLERIKDSLEKRLGRHIQMDND